MRCRHIRTLLLEDSHVTSAAAQDHMRTCESCAVHLRKWEELQAGLRRVAAQSPPEPSLGFARRVIGRLQEPAPAERPLDPSLVRTGRNFVYAALTAALLLVLGVLVPASGPVRSHAAPVESQPEAVAAQNYPIYSGGLLDNDFEFAPPSGNR